MNNQLLMICNPYWLILESAVNNNNICLRDDECTNRVRLAAAQTGQTDDAIQVITLTTKSMMWSVIQVQNQLSSFTSELGWINKSWTCSINWPVVQTRANNDKDVSINYNSSIYPLTPVQLLARITEDWKKNHARLAQINKKYFFLTHSRKLRNILYSHDASSLPVISIDDFRGLLMTHLLKRHVEEHILGSIVVGKCDS